MKETYFDLAALSPEEFEDLVEASFLAQKAEKKASYTVLEVSRSGRGNDDGRDLLVRTLVSDCATSWEVTWLVQCKHKAKSGNAVQPSDFSNEFSFVDITTEHGANGYLLVCSTRPGKRLQNHLNGLSCSERNPYRFVIWDIAKVTKEITHYSEVMAQFFPARYQQLQERDKWLRVKEFADKLPPESQAELKTILGPEK